jgi:hypothetical protein
MAICPGGQALWQTQSSSCLLIDGKPKPWKGGGKFYLEWREDGKWKTMIAGSSPRETRDAWYLKSGELSGSILTSKE